MHPLERKRRFFRQKPRIKITRQHDETCEGKKRWPCEITARAGAMAVIERNDPGTPDALYVYRCPTCRGWHLTKNRQKSSPPVTVDDIKGVPIAGRL